MATRSTAARADTLSQPVPARSRLASLWDIRFLPGHSLLTRLVFGPSAPRKTQWFESIRLALAPPPKRASWHSTPSNSHLGFGEVPGGVYKPAAANVTFAAPLLFDNEFGRRFPGVDGTVS